MKRILTVGDLRKVIADLDDDFTIEMRVRTRVSDEELAKRSYPYPFDTEYIDGIEFDDIGYSDKVVCFGVETNNE
jgi:hypothetical protein